MPEAPSLPDDWTEPERWAWAQIAAGKIADFNARAKEQGSAAEPLDPALADGWGDDRRLRAGFLQRILTDPPFVEATPFSGVRILGALVHDEVLDLEHARLEHLFWMEKSRIEAAVQARNLRVDGELSFEGSFIAGRLDLTAARIDEQLILGLGAIFRGTVDLAGARIGGNLVMRAASFSRPVKLKGATVAGSAILDDSASFEDAVDLTTISVGDELYMTGARFNKEVVLSGASIGGKLVMRNVSIAGPVRMNDAKITGSAFLDVGAHFNDVVVLANASIGGQLAMKGASFAGRVNLNSATITESAFLDDSASFEDAIDLTGARIGGQLVMKGASFAGPVNLNGARVAGSTLLNDGARFKGAIYLTGASIGRELAMKGASFAGPVSLNGAKIVGSAFLDDRTSFEDQVDLVGARIGRNLTMVGVRFNDVVDLAGARIGGNLLMRAASFAGRVSLNGAMITGSAFLDDRASFEDEVDFTGASIGGQLAMIGAHFAGPVSLDCAKITGTCLCDGASFEDGVDFTGASIGMDLDLSGATFASTVRLTNARIGSELRLGSSDHPSARWGSGPLDLRNARCASLQDRWPTDKELEEADSWPSEIDLEGFTYDLLGGLLGGGGGPADMRARPASSYVAWLARQRPFSPQPYEQLTKVLRASGDFEKANDILYAARKRQRRDYREGGAWGKWLGMSLLSASIGYGLGRRYFRALIWVALFTLIGTELLRLYGNQPEHGWLALAFASFDRLLPAVTLDPAHEALFSNAATDGFVQPAGLIMYFYIHKLIGWLLGIFLLAGLAGLTQRS